MSDASKFSPDNGLTIYDLKDKNAVHYKDNAVLGAKNWIPNKGTSQSLDGITWTVNDDKTINANGTKNNSNDGFVILSRNSDNYKIPTGQYIFSGYPKEASASNNCMLKLQATRNGSLYQIASLESDVEQTVTVYDTDVLQCVCYVLPTKNVSNVIFKPMLRLASDTDTTYQPYTMTNRDLTDYKVNKNSSYTSVLSDVFSDYTNINSVNCIKNDILCNIRLTSKQVSVSGSWTTIGTLNEKYRPRILIYETAIDAAGVPFGWVRIHDNGTIEVYQSTGNTRVVNFSSIYLI